EANAADERLDHADFLVRRNHEQLQAELLEEFQAVARVLLGRSAERLVDTDKGERACARIRRLHTELVGEAGREDCVGKLLLLAAGLAGGAVVVLELDPGLAP